MSVASLIARLTRDPYYSKRIASVRNIPPRAPVYGDLDGQLSDGIRRYLKDIRLYRHQCQAINGAMNGRNIMLTTPTASGKSLAFNIPVFEGLWRGRQATALYLYPTKALSNDQLKSIREIEAVSGIRVHPEIYDGDTPSGRRPAIREKSRIIITNPYELHQVLPWHYKWQRFLGNLKYVVIDEAHQYRGVFGSNVALVIRRLRRICGYYGSSPQFILSSATIANPLELANNLTGLQFELISDDGAPRGNKFLLLYNPFCEDAKNPSAQKETKQLLMEALDHDLHSLCFTVSRKMAELLAFWTRSALSEDKPGLTDLVASYRAGYLPAARREIESKLKQGDLKIVTATNALELGIDIGALDSVIISGYPGSVVSVWQQAGRAGRGAGEAVAVLVAFQDPLDQYFMNHPEIFFDSSFEHAIISLDNPYIKSGHLLCAASELPLLPESDIAYFGDGMDGFIETFERELLLRRSGSGYVYTGRARPADMVSLDAFDSEVFKVVCAGRVIETVDRARAFREAHDGAVLLHQGATYVVKSLDLDTSTVHVERAEVDYFTESVKAANIEVLMECRHKEAGSFRVSLGSVVVNEEYTGYKIRKYDSVIGYRPLNLPPSSFKTSAVWFTVPQELKRILFEQQRDFSGGLHGIEHAMIGIMPFQVMCDRRDIGGVSAPFHFDTRAATVFIYDGYEEGIGLAEKAFELFDSIARMTYELVRDCPCDQGCPGCIISPKCGSDNQPLDKKAAEMILERLVRDAQGPDPASAAVDP
jgi:DEAD/DEAH box helicase domain-containing protein